jgi:glycosyltransferase involved in cell wall biosynthesis
LHEISRARTAYDAVQVNTATPLPIARDLGIPVVYTLHHSRDEELSRRYLAHPEVHYVAISRRQLDLEAPLVRSCVIHHGVDVDEYPLSLKDEGYALHLGRFAREKGTHHAIDAAMQAHVPIVLAGRVHEKDDDCQYFEREVSPMLGRPGVINTGEADHARKVELLRGARALLCPIDWEEPFGLVAIEAMLTGTPVIGFPRGSFPEVIDEGVTGMLVSDVREMAAAIGRARRWDRQRCAARARQRFSSPRMASDYERVFESLARHSGPYCVSAEKQARVSRLIG